MTERGGLHFRLGPIALGLAVAGLVWLAVALPILGETLNWGEDFTAYRNAAERLTAEGSPYNELTTSGRFEPQGGGHYLYPPPLSIAFGPFTGIDAETGAVIWYLLKVGALVLAAGLMPIRPTTKLLALGISLFSYAVLRDLVEGNFSILMVLALAAGWRWLDRPAGSIALACATAVRATTGAFLIWFAMRRAWWSMIWMVGAGMVLLLLSLPFVGIDGYLDYFALLGNVDVTGELSQNRHLTALGRAAGLPADQPWLVLAPTWLLSLGAMALSTRRDPATGYMVTAAASLLLAPLLWDHYLSMLMLPAAFLFERGRRWAIVLPLLSSIPTPFTPLVAVAALLLPFLARDPQDDAARTEPDALAVAA